MSMHAGEESDEGVVPMKRPNKEGLLTLGGGRGGKDLAQGKRRRDGRGPDTAPGRRVERACCREGGFSVQALVRWKPRNVVVRQHELASTTVPARMQ
jgi:hypothetical protein